MGCLPGPMSNLWTKNAEEIGLEKGFLQADEFKIPQPRIRYAFRMIVANKYPMYHYNTDRYGMDSSRQFEVQQLTSQLQYPVEDVLRAIQEVGYNAEDVEEYIRDRYNRS